MNGIIAHSPNRPKPWEGRALRVRNGALAERTAQSGELRKRIRRPWQRTQQRMTLFRKPLIFISEAKYDGARAWCIHAAHPHFLVWTKALSGAPDQMRILRVRRFHLPQNGLTHITARQVKGANDAMETRLHICDGVQYLFVLFRSGRCARVASSGRVVGIGDSRRYSSV